MNAPAGLAQDDRRQKFVPDGRVLTRFILAMNFVDVIIGPVGSGKSKGCCARIMKHAQEQAPSLVDGKRRTRWAVVRNSYPDLKRTTIRTWLEMFPEHKYGRFFWGQPPSHLIRFGDVELQADFLALDKPEDIRKLRSGEYTGVFFNELQYSEKELFDEAQSRVNRYPSVEHGGPTWTGVIADANAPDEDHWLAMMAGMVDLPPGMSDEEIEELRWPQEWGLYIQPPALIEQFDERGVVVGYEINPKAENLRWLQPDYYTKQRVGKSKAWIDSRLMVRVVLVVEGSPVWPMFRREFHVAREVLEPVLGDGREVLLWLDFGRSPAALFAQEIGARVYVQFELQGIGEGAVTFAPKVKRFLEKNYAGCSVRCFGDPKGRDKGQSDERNAYDVFAAHGIIVQPAPVKQNNIETRVGAVAYILNDNPAGINRLVISPRCRTLIVGMAGRYHNERDERGELVPSKNRYSHSCDALQYGILGLGEGRRMIGLTAANNLRPVKYTRAAGSRRRVS